VKMSYEGTVSTIVSVSNVTGTVLPPPRMAAGSPDCIVSDGRMTDE
jgi:hypothetical protein